MDVQILPGESKQFVDADRDVEEPDPGIVDRATRAGGGSTLARWVPGIIVLAAAVVSLIRNDVDAPDVLAYLAYLAVAVVLPGVLVSRAWIGRRGHLVDDLAFGAVTGLALQIGVWMILRELRLDVLIPWWWLAVVGPFVAVPTLRHHWRARFESPVHAGWSWSMASIAVYLVGFVDLRWFRVNPIPPSGGVATTDTWWHLAIIREFLRTGPAQIPQVAGEPVSYHANAHAHMAVSAVTSRVDADVIFLRLWMIPIVLVTIAVFAALAQEVTGRLWTGPFAVALGFVLLVGGYLWLGLAPRGTPLGVLSPSQIMVLPFAFAAAWGIVRALRSGLAPWAWMWLAVVAIAGTGAKPTFVPVLLGGTVVAMGASIVRTRSVPRSAALVAVGLLVLQIWTMSGGLEERGSRITVLGSLRTTAIYQAMTQDDSLRGVNDGLFLDSLTGTRALAAAGLTLGWFVLAQVFHFIGVTAVIDRRCRRDPATWWLIGALAAGVGAYFVLDHSASSQAYFLHLSLPFGIILTTMLISTVYAGIERARALNIAVAGAVIGASTALVSRALSRARVDAGGFGVVDRATTPVVVVSFVALAIWLICRRWPRSTISTKRGAAALALAAMVGVAVPTTVESMADQLVRWVEPPAQSFDTGEPGYLSPEEQAAAVWLDENSAETDVVASNTQCRGLTTDQSRCNAAGFMVSGIAGRRVVLEGWGYTRPAHEANGVDGIPRTRTAPGWPRRYELSIAAIEDPSAEVIEALATDYGADWIFAARRAGPVSDRLADFAVPVFDNGAVAIYRIGPPE